MAVKLDINKAYDWINWSFLEALYSDWVLMRDGFVWPWKLYVLPPTLCSLMVNHMALSPHHRV